MFRPQMAHGFQLLVTREDLPQALALLATQQGIELETQEEDTQNLLSGEVAEYLENFQQLASQYQAFWPADHAVQPLSVDKQDALQESPQQVLAAALAALERWRDEAEGIIQRLEEEKVRNSELSLYAELAHHLSSQAADWDLSALANSDRRWLRAELFVLPEPLPPLSAPIRPILCPITGDHHAFLLAVADPEEMGTLLEAVATAKGRALSIPYWPQGAAREVLPEIQSRLLNSTEKVQRLHQALALIYRRHDLARHLQAVAYLHWFFAAIQRVRSGSWLLRLSGWTDQADESRLNRQLQGAHLHALLDLSTHPSGSSPPVVLVNPWWVKPFELFARLLGMPGRHEVDPSPLLAFIAPLLFGYMFGDVGQGVLLALGGWGLHLFAKGVRDSVVPWLLITGGLSSTLFGLLFGSLFCREDLLTPLWLHPTQHPLAVLGYPILLGIVLLLTGMVLEGISHYWQGKLSEWWLRKAAVLLFYLSLVGGLLHPLGWTLAAAALAWFLLGNRLAGDSLLTLLGRLAHLVEVSLQLAVNTLSFARVGAFALAHAGLSQAIVTLAGLPQQAWAAFLILLLGNLLIIVLEGLVVSVQTTRLLLFEFFVRFLQGVGRPFRPLPAPPGWLFQPANPPGARPV
ncbi:MAG: ATPase [Magnetococcales bacterium]|nr:ATPase [Magnetococcales bacterium]